VWVLPVVVLAVGATGIWFALARNRREPKLHATDADVALVDRERAQQ
jgi:cytochrome c-type biogenesis protein CcmH/NrfF